MQAENKTTDFISIIKAWLAVAVDKVNNTPAFVVLFILFCGNFLTCIPDGNEENYLELAKQFIDPDWITDSFTLTEFAGTRLIYQYVCGFVLQFVSFETLTFTGRLLIIAWYSFAIASLFKKIAITNMYALFLLQVVFFIQQSTFGGENFLLGFEPKHIAYGFILLALNAFAEQKQFKTLLLIVGASWFHVLLGGWFFLGFIAYQLFNQEVSFKQLCIMGMLYALLLFPFAWYLVSEIVLHSIKMKNGLSADWIYCYYRNPHHTAIFSSMESFYDNHAVGVLWTFIMGFTTTVIYPKILSNELIPLNKFVSVLSCILLVNVVIAFFDTDGHFVKYYPFRLASVQLFLFYVVTASVVRTYFSRQETIQAVFLIAVAAFFGMACLLNAYKMIRFLKNYDTSFYKITRYIKTHTPKDAVVYYSNKAEDHTLSFTREAERDRFVVYKFVPAGTDKIYEWYDRILMQEQIDKEPSKIIEVKKKYKIDYILTTDSIGFEKIKLMTSEPPYLLYKFE